MNLDDVRFDANGLVPAIVRDATSREVLMLAFMNRESVQKTMSSGETWFFSRSRQQLWHKGATSGNRQVVRAIALDCDNDTLLIDVDPLGPACHTGEMSCFTMYPRVPQVSSPASVAREAAEDGRGTRENLPPEGGLGRARGTRETLSKLEATLQQRKRDLPEGSYSAYLFTAGRDKILKKIGEEATEVVIAAKGEGRERLVSESADLLFHLTALLVNEDVSIDEVMAELEERAAITKGTTK